MRCDKRARTSESPALPTHGFRREIAYWDIEAMAELGLA